MNETELKVITQKLADVEAPPPPEWQPLISASVTVAVAVVLAVALIRLRSRRAHPAKAADASREALHQLQQLQRAWQRGESDDQESAYRLATLLRLGLGLDQLTETPPPALSAEAQPWRELMQQLNRLRYQPPAVHEDEGQGGDEIGAQLTPDSFARIERWLRQGGAC